MKKTEYKIRKRIKIVMITKSYYKMKIFEIEYKKFFKSTELTFIQKLFIFKLLLPILVYLDIILKEVKIF